MKFNKALAVFLFFAIVAVPLYSAKVEDQTSSVETVRLSGEDSAMIASKLSEAQKLIKLMMKEDIESADLIPLLKENEKIYDNLKTSTDIKDPVAVKEMLLAKLAAFEGKAQDRIYLHKRMNLMYQIMVISGMLAIILMIIYSIYMFSKRK